MIITIKKEIRKVFIVDLLKKYFDFNEERKINFYLQDIEFFNVIINFIIILFPKIPEYFYFYFCIDIKISRIVSLSKRYSYTIKNLIFEAVNQSASHFKVAIVELVAIITINDISGHPPNITTFLKPNISRIFEDEAAKFPHF